MIQKQKLQAYKDASHTVSKARQIVMLYDGMIRFLKQACEAMKGQRIEDRYNLLVKTANIVMGLQGSLDFDQSKEVATTLYDYYSSVDARIMTLHRTNSIEDCEALIDDLKQMRDVWSHLDAPQDAEDTSSATDPSQNEPETVTHYDAGGMYGGGASTVTISA